MIRVSFTILQQFVYFLDLSVFIFFVVLKKNYKLKQILMKKKKKMNKRKGLLLIAIEMKKAII